MTVHESRDEHAPEDDTALLIAALDHSWSWYDGRSKRAIQVINFYLVGSAVTFNAYTNAISGNHYDVAAALAIAALGLTAIASMAGLREANAAALAVPVLAELQGRIAGKLEIDPFRMVRFQAGIKQRHIAIILATLGLATLLDIGALVYALIHWKQV
jgi:hypothetical protein